MTATAKILAIFVLLGFCYVFFLGGSVLLAAVGAVGATVLTQAIIRYLRPRTLQEETLDNLGFTGLSLGPNRKSKEAQDNTAPN